MENCWKNAKRSRIIGCPTTRTRRELRNKQAVVGTGSPIESR